MKQKTDTMPSAYEFGSVEDRLYAFWETEGLFSADPDSGREPYSIAIPPPNVTGILTLGHVLNNSLQDILVRWRRMQGYEACWFPGMDHAGIATESKVERFLREEEDVCRDDLGREEFIKRVWRWKEQYGGTIIRQLRKLGASCDWNRERFTMDEGLSDAVKEVFVRLYDKGYIYKGRRMINWCPVSRTALSDEEVIYREVHGYFYHFKYPLSDGSGHLEIATTRPETMLGDTAVAVHPEDERYNAMVGGTVDLPLTGRKIPIIADEHANPEFGTGCVKITPAHDPNDFEVGLRHKLDFINVMNPDATMNAAAGEEFVGLDRFECREKILGILDEAGLMIRTEDHIHSVGYSERGDVPIEPVVSEQWFVDMKELARPAIEAVKNGDIKFYPERWTKTYFHWMENIRDWCISRQIWWGHRIPAWYGENGEIHVGREAPSGTGWVQDEDVLDTWFSSWLWPFSIMGWPKETREQEFFYPTNDLVTGPDIIFFWVARMIMAGCEFKGEIPFRNVYFTSIIRDEQGRKLSKSLGNSPDPLDVIKTYGADALRFSIIYIAPIGQDIRYSNEKCEIGRNFANKLWNASRYRKMQGGVSADFADISGIDPELLRGDDRWILGRLDAISENVCASLENFRFHEAAHDIYEFVWNEFCDWYVESAKQGLCEGGGVKSNILRILDYTLYGILCLLHPFMPFITEEIAHQLGFLAEEESIMNSPYPNPMGDSERNRFGIDTELVSAVESKFELVRAGRNLRSSYNIPPSKKINYSVKPVGETCMEFFREELASIKALLRAEEVEINMDYVPDGAAPSIVTDAGTIFMPLAGVVDVNAEKKKLEKQKNDIENWISGSRKKLSNRSFLEKAPKNVVEDARKHLSELEGKYERVKEMLNSLS